MDDAHVNKQPAGHELDKQPIPGEDDLTSLEHMNFHKRLVATARSLKKQKRKLKTAEDALRMRWSKVLNTADKYDAIRQEKSYPKCKLLPKIDEEALEPPQSKKKEAAWPDRRPDDRLRAARGAAHKPAHDQHKDPRKKDDPVRSIYGPKKKTPGSNITRRAFEDNGTPKYRGAAHPLCFTDEVLDHEFPAGFKPVNIEAYDETTDLESGLRIISYTYIWVEEMISTP